MISQNVDQLDLKVFKLAVEDAYDHIIITDLDGIILYANKAVKRTTGFSQKEIVGNTPALWGSQMPKEFYQDFWNRIKVEKKSYVGELVNKRKDGLLYDAEVHVIPVLDKEDTIQYFIGLERDITEQKETEKTRDEFISIVSHQLKTPLTSIRWLIENVLAGDYGTVTDKQQVTLEEIYKSSKNMMKLVTDLLNISRIEAGKFVVDPQPLQLEELIQEQVEEVSPLLNAKKGTIKFNKPKKKIKEISLDKVLYRQVIHNLLTNAIKYSTSGKCNVVVTLKKHDENNLVFSVEDSGIGIPESAQEKVFQRYYRAANAMKTTKGGTGLGLYIIKKIINMSGGKIWFKSVEDKGTTFFLTIPIKGMKKAKSEE